MGKYIYLKKFDIKIHYEEYGKGYPIVFVHGLGGSLNNWKDSYESFKSNGYRAIGIDLPGYGKSQKPLIDYSIEYYAKVLLEFIIELGLGDYPILVGNSMGGHISSFYAAKYKSRLKALVLVNSSGLNNPNFIEEILLNIAFDKKNLDKLFKYLINVFPITLFHNPRHENARFFSEEQLNYSKSEDYKNYCHALEKSVKAMIEKPLDDIISEIDVPTLIIWGMNDKFISSYYGSKFNHNIKNSIFIKISEAGHMPQLEKPNEFNNSLLNFINSLELKKSKNFISKILPFFSKKGKHV
ncbi:MAG TPA: alpha/beta hydrolase [Spirochaetota bacterium]|nr:alpha/beta hydrolase [Spirochaetota bacterium]HOM39083.1 alpha/beta hydrolase [Spirochaetota bacterium]HPQ49989.1 alpha/beta hydrolase [Spirochaetota bacterium]